MIWIFVAMFILGSKREEPRFLGRGWEGLGGLFDRKVEDKFGVFFYKNFIDRFAVDPARFDVLLWYVITKIWVLVIRTNRAAFGLGEQIIADLLNHLRSDVAVKDFFYIFLAESVDNQIAEGVASDAVCRKILDLDDDLHFGFLSWVCGFVYAVKSSDT